MSKSELQASHRKCYSCGHTTPNLDTTKCKCGKYMYLVSQIYSPKVSAEKNK